MVKIVKKASPKFILASASPRRLELLRQLRRPFQVHVSNAKELTSGFLTPRECVLFNAFRKALAVAKLFPDALVLGADTEVCLDGRVFGKPKDARDAARMLGALQGKTHEVITGVCLVQLSIRQVRTFAVVSHVTFRRLTPAAIRDYLGKIQPLDKAGAYAIQEHGDDIIAGIHGSYSNVVGLPLEELRQELRRWPKNRLVNPKNFAASPPDPLPDSR